MGLFAGIFDYEGVSEVIGDLSGRGAEAQLAGDIHLAVGSESRAGRGAWG